MTTYHVWLTGQDNPEVVHALEVTERDGELWFMLSDPVMEGGKIRFSVRTYQPEQWSRWSIVHDEADHVHI